MNENMPSSELVVDDLPLIIEQSAKNALPLNGLNPLIAAAMPLILLIIALKDATPNSSLNELRQQIINEVNIFEVRAKKLQYPTRLILSARYCLCTALDEVILLTRWGNSGGWAQQTLLSSIHKETYGGERFFLIMEKMTEEPKENLHVLELLYFILSLGFEGKYYNQEKSIREEIRHKLFSVIMSHRDSVAKGLSPSLKLLPKRKSDTKRLEKWKILSLTVFVILLLGIVSNGITYFMTRDTLQQLLSISQTLPPINLLAKPLEKIVAPVRSLKQQLIRYRHHIHEREK